jgi:hypothetical protein
MKTFDFLHVLLKKRKMKIFPFFKISCFILIILSVYSCASLNSKDFKLRIKAVNKTTDQNILFKIVNEDIDFQVKFAAFNRITDSNLMNKLAIESLNKEIRLEAIKKVTDQNTLFIVALSDDSYKSSLADKDNEIKIAAFNRITDSNLHNRLAIECKIKEIRKMSVNKITDQDVLFKVLMQDLDNEIMLYAFNRITESVIFNKLATQHGQSKIRRQAISKITDQNVLYNVVLDNIIPEVQMDAVKKLSDKSLINKLVANTTSTAIIKYLINKVDDQNILQNFAIKDIDGEIKIAAINLITDKTFIYNFALKADNKEIRHTSMMKLSPDLLAKLADDFKDQDLKLKVVDMLSDQNELIKISINNKVWEVRKAAFDKLTEESLSNISNYKKESAIILASRIKSGKSTWEKAFSQSSLSNVIGAAALVDSPQPTADDIVEACHKFIRLGNTSRIPELRNLLLRFGDVTLAEDYLNCGNNQLYKAAEEWGNINGYNIGSGYGSNRVRWGEGM